MVNLDDVPVGGGGSKVRRAGFRELVIVVLVVEMLMRTDLFGWTVRSGKLAGSSLCRDLIGGMGV